MVEVTPLFKLWQMLTHVGQTRCTGDTPVKVMDEGGNILLIKDVRYDQTLNVVWINVRDE